MSNCHLKVAHWADSKTEDNRHLAPAAVDHTIRRQVEKLAQQRMAKGRVVSLNEFRNMKAEVDARSILVVDDEEVMRNALKRILTAEGHKVHMAADGLEFSKAVEDMRFDLILLDVNLPWVDGYELCEILKSHPSFKRVPVVMVSARTTNEDIERGLSSGASDYVIKPFDVDALLKIINKHLLEQAS
jgi:two-component system aerobic respiration control protein ArcA